MKIRKRGICLIITLFLTLSCKNGKEARVNLSTDAGRFSITSSSIGIHNVDLIVHTSSNGVEEDLFLSGSPIMNETADYFNDEIGSGVRRSIEGREEGRYSILLHIYDYSSNFFTLSASVENLASDPLTVYGFSFVPAEISGDEPDGLLTNGYQSWSPAVISRIIPGDEADERKFENIENNQDTLLVDYRNSWWFSVLHNPEQSILWGALTAKTWKTRIITYSNEKKVIAKIILGRTYVKDAVAKDKVILEPGSSVSSERIFIGIYNDPVTGLDSYGRFIANLNPPPPPLFIPVGWNSWNELFENIDESKILSNAQFIKDNFPEHGFNNIQVDDGWERSWGDWEPNEKFPSGMDGLSNQLKDMGFIPGIWLAPFLVSESAPVYSQHPDWLLRDEEGNLLKYDRYFILDTTNPDAMQWLLSEIRKIINWGYRYLKLDFLFAGAYEAKRFRENTTSMQAYREAMSAILNEARKGDAYVLACGAPILPTAGLAHGARIGGDIAFSALPYNFSFIKNEARNIAVRFFLNHVFANDPDTALLRSVPINEARVNLSSVLLSGKIFALGDNLSELPGDQISMLLQIKDFPVFHGIKNPSINTLMPIPIDLFKNFSEPANSVATILIYPETYYTPSVWALKLDQNSAVLGLFNWENTEKELGFTIESAGLKKGNVYSATELWSNTLLGDVTGEFKTTLPPRSAELIYLQVKD